MTKLDLNIFLHKLITGNTWYLIFGEIFFNYFPNHIIQLHPFAKISQFYQFGLRWFLALSKVFAFVQQWAIWMIFLPIPCHQNLIIKKKKWKLLQNEQCIYIEDWRLNPWDEYYESSPRILGTQFLNKKFSSHSYKLKLNKFQILFIFFP